MSVDASPLPNSNSAGLVVDAATSLPDLPEVTLEPPGGVPWEEFPAITPAAADECRVTIDEELPTNVNLQGSDELWVWDQAQLLLTRHALDGDAYIEQQFDADGGLIVLHVGTGIGAPISVEYVRDAQGNTTTRVSGNTQTGYAMAYADDTGLCGAG